jgi:heme oxygenase
MSSPDAPAAPAPDTPTTRWPPLLVALRRAARPDRARVAAYMSFARCPASWAEYGGFLVRHRAWLTALDGALVEGLPGAPPAPGEEGDRAAPDVGPGSLPPARNRAQALGYLYVREAFRLGSEVLSRRIQGAVESPAEAPAGERPARRSWYELVRALWGAGPEEQAEVLESARLAYSAWERRLGPSLARLGLVDDAVAACGG